MEKKQTAVEWLVEQIKSDQNQKALSASEWMDVIEQAKAMEKQQITDAWSQAIWTAYNSTPELYYNNTYRNGKETDRS